MKAIKTFSYSFILLSLFFLTGWEKSTSLIKTPTNAVSKLFKPKDGVHKDYHENGQLKKETTYIDGMIVAETKYAYHKNWKLSAK